MPEYDISRNSVTRKVKEDCAWYVVPWDGVTKEVLLSMLSDDEHILKNFTLPNGITVKGVWECSHETIHVLRSAGAEVKFTVFRRRGNRFEEIPFWGNVLFRTTQ